MQPLTDFSAGLWLTEASGKPEPGFAVPDNALLEADNVEYLEAGGLRGRRGRTRRYSLTGEITGLFRHYPRAGNNAIQFVGFPSTIANDGGAGTAWTIPGSGPSGALASVTFAASGQSQGLLLSNFGFALDPADIVTSILAAITTETTSQDPAVIEVTIQFLQGLAPVGPNFADTGKTWPPARTARGSVALSNGDFGVNWTPGDINDPGFGLLIVIQTVGTVSPSVPITASIALFGMDVFVTRTVADPPSLIVHEARAAQTHIWATKPDNTLVELATYDPAPRPHYQNWPEQGATFIADGVNPMLRYQHNLALLPTERSLEPLLQARSTIGTVPTPNGPYLALWKGRLWATTAAEIGFSVYASEINDPTTWFADLQLSLNDPKGGTITGLVALSGSPDALIGLKDTCLFSFQTSDPLQGGQLTRYCDVGCNAPDTVALTPWGIVYLGIGGVYLTDGFSATPQEVSTPLRALFQPRKAPPTIFPNAVGVYYQNLKQYHLKLDPALDEGWVAQLTSAGGNLRVAWSHLPVMPFNAGTTWDGRSDAGQLLYGGLDGFIREADFGTTDDDGTADGQPIAIVVRTRSQALDDRTPLLREGRVVYVEPQFRAVVPSITGALRYNDDDTLVVPFTAVDGTFPTSPGYATPRATITEMATFGRVVDVRLLSADGPDFELHRVAMPVQLRSVRQWR